MYVAEPLRWGAASFVCWLLTKVPLELSVQTRPSQAPLPPVMVGNCENFLPQEKERGEGPSRVEVSREKDVDASGQWVKLHPVWPLTRSGFGKIPEEKPLVIHMKSLLASDLLSIVMLSAGNRSHLSFPLRRSVSHCVVFAHSHQADLMEWQNFFIPAERTCVHFCPQSDTFTLNDQITVTVSLFEASSVLATYPSVSLSRLTDMFQTSCVAPSAGPAALV